MTERPKPRRPPRPPYQALPLDVLGDLAAAGAEDALLLSYQSTRDAWEHRARRRQDHVWYCETAGGNVDSTLGIVRSLLT